MDHQPSAVIMLPSELPRAPTSTSPGLGGQKWAGKGSPLIPIEPDLEPVGGLIWPERQASGITQRVNVAMLRQEGAQVQGLCKGGGQE
jgi:hypothetical protein